MLMLDQQIDQLGDYLERLRGMDTEALAVIHFGLGDAIIARRITSDNAACRTAFPIRTIVADALNLGSLSILLAHNHPSGIAQPSEADIKSTRILTNVLWPLGIMLTDHLIVTGTDIYSLKSGGHF